MAETRPQALLITPVAADPNGVGRAKRAHQWLHALSLTHDVDLVLVESTHGDCAASVPDVLRLRPRAPRWLTRLPVGWAAPSNADRRRIVEQFAGRRYDRLLCFRLYLAEYALEIAACAEIGRIELDLDDIESDTATSLARLYAATGQPWQSRKANRQAVQYRRIEDRWLARFDTIHVCSEDDQRRLRARFPDSAIRIEPNRLWRALTPSRAAPPPDTARILFVGALGYWPNQDAVRRFARHVLPLLRSRESRWVFAIAGRSAPPSLRAMLAGLPGIDWCGEVEDLAPLYAAAQMVVAPLRAGGGTKLKVLEALAHGRPVVASAEAVRGLNLRAECDFLAAETDQEFADQCTKLRAVPERARQIAAAGRVIAEQHYLYGESVCSIPGSQHPLET